jgi:hypothetical protein
MSLKIRSQKSEVRSQFLLTFFVICLSYCALGISQENLPSLNPSISPLDPNNQPLLFKRLVATFDRSYALHLKDTAHQGLAEGLAFYYLRQELQALIDMWRATSDPVYLDQAEKRALQAMTDARAHVRPLLWHNQPRGEWPCFFLKKVASQTGGHNQINDFQGAAGLLMVAQALKQADRSAYKPIADFVEQSIIHKWLQYKPSVQAAQLTGPKSDTTLLVVLDRGRDKREHFACLCMDLDSLGYHKYPYKAWAKMLVDLYLGIRTDLQQAPPQGHHYGRRVPKDWGVLRQPQSGGFIWYFGYTDKDSKALQVMDTSHGNRTVWLAAQAYEQGLIDRQHLDGFVRTLKLHVWAPRKGPFYFNNFVDGTDRAVQQRAPGLKGNLWFGWHRLAVYDAALRDLFLSIAYDLTNTGEFLPDKAQNKAMANAPLCFYAWGARLLSPSGRAQVFP